MRILFLGAPGAGKGTQCKKLAAKLSLPHLSSGDLLREAVKQGTNAGLEAKSFMDKGALVPDPTLVAMFKDKLSSPECKKGFILDGFPRNLAQAKALDEMLAQIKANLNVVINLTTSDNLLTERITGRRTCSNKECAHVYHVKYAPPKTEGVCDKCGQPLLQRDDDRQELVAKRLATYREQTAPLVDYYLRAGILETVDGNGEQESIFKAILHELKVTA